MSKRRKQLIADVEELKRRCEGKRITDIKLEEETLLFAYDNGNPKQKEDFTLNATDDYPDGYSMLFSAKSSEPKMCSGNVQTIVLDILKQQDNKYGLKSSANKLSESGEYDEDGGSGEEELEEEEEAEGWEEEYQTEVSYQEHKELALEVSNYNKIFGKETATTKPMPLLETVDVELDVPYADIIEHSTCSAWGIESTLPFIVKLTFSANYYLEAMDQPKLEIYQVRSGKKTFGLKYQLEAIMNKYVKESWPKNSGHAIRAIEYVVPEKKSNKTSKKEEKKGLLDKVTDLIVAKKDKPSKSSQKSDPSADGDLTQLLDMGFSIEMARNALKMTRTVEEALNLLLTDPESCSHVDEKMEIETSTKVSSGKRADKIDELFKEPEKAITSERKIREISSKYGFLVMVASYLRERLPTLNDYCVICDQPHVFAHGNMLKPAVCSRDLCVFSFQQLGVAADFVDSIATGAEVVDLLVAFATVSAKSARKELIFEPFPTIFDPKNPKKALLSATNKDFGLVNEILVKFPSVEQMSKAKDFGDMKTKMDRSHPYAFPLLQWIITSNRSHIVKMHADKQIKSMVTTHQYLLLSAPPEKENKFREMRKKYGSCFAFHGSSIENWHSILRQGLKNASGTKLQVNGAAYGPGIYISPHAQTSFGYSRIYNYNNKSKSDETGNRFLDTNNINCIAICEVIDHDIKKHGTVWVQPTEDFVVTRFFFVYTGSDVGSATTCSTEVSTFVEEIKNAIKAHSLNE